MELGSIHINRPDEPKTQSRLNGKYEPHKKKEEEQTVGTPVVEGVDLLRIFMCEEGFMNPT
jgi:hypothetical protein